MVKEYVPETTFIVFINCRQSRSHHRRCDTPLNKDFNLAKVIKGGRPGSQSKDLMIRLFSSFVIGQPERIAARAFFGLPLSLRGFLGRSDTFFSLGPAV